MASSSSTVNRSPTVIATSCWARTSSGLRGSASARSRRRACPSRPRRSRRSPRYLGKMTPLLGSPTWWPARPMRWRPRATEVGLSTWITRSTAPMSIPSSRLDVATRAGSRPAFSSSSISRRCSLAMRAVVGADELFAGELVQALREALREAPAVDEDDGAAMLADQLQDPRVDGGPDAAFGARRPGTGPPGCSSIGSDLAEPRHVLDRHDDLELERLARARVRRC